MRKYFSLFLTALAVIALLAPARVKADPVPNEVAKVEAATAVLDQVMRMPDNGIPANLLNSAYGVAVIPGVVHAAAGIGTSSGKGILVVKTQDGNWSNPAFIDLRANSIGPQFGVETTDVVLVFNSPRGIDAIERGSFTLGTDLSVAAGPIGRTGEFAPGTRQGAEILSYSRSHGLFAGASLTGAALQIDQPANRIFYQRRDITPNQIFASSDVLAPKVANTFKCMLASYTNTSMRVCG